jgi:hypothetical protein
VLLQVNGTIVTSFVDLEDACDRVLESSGDGIGTIELTIERGGDELTVFPVVRPCCPLRV